MSKSSHPFLWTAMQVSAGRLGVITAVTFKILPNAKMKRTKVDVGVDAFLDTMKRVQDGYLRAGDAAPEVQEMDGTMFCWFVTRRRESPAALWRSRSTWVNGAPQVTSATKPAPLSVAGSLSDSQLLAALTGGMEPPVVQQPMFRTERGAGFSLLDMGALRSQTAASRRGLSDACLVQALFSLASWATAPR
jgi:hypothetical protein